MNGILLRLENTSLSSNNSVSSTSSSDSTDSTAEDNSESSSSTSNLVPIPRRIRFAPLPDPRSFDDDPHDLPCDTAHTTPHPDPDHPDHSPSIDIHSEKPYSNPPFQCLPPPPIPALIVNQSKKQSQKSRAWFKPFLKRSSTAPSSTPNSPGHSDTDPPSRPSSVHSNTSTASLPSWGLPLGPWATPTSLATSKRSTTDVHLKRTQTSKTLTGNVRMPVLGAIPRRAGVRKGTRMLNGRVYGSRRSADENPFANARDDPDPEFVEWGYGGMGSVNGGGNSMWKRLQSDSVALGDGAAAVPQPDGPGQDDSSGMGWVRMRREQREREKREKEEKAALAENAGEGEAQSPPSSDITDPPDSTAKTTAPSAAIPHTPPPPDDSAARESHILRAVAVPAPSHRHVRGNSSTSPPTPSRVGPIPDVQAVAVGVVDLQDFRRIVKGTEGRDDDDGDDESESESERSEDDEDEDDEEQNRKTALCARVEKISRHQDKV